MDTQHIILIGAPIDSGQQRPGCLMGPAAARVAGISAALDALGHRVSDWGDLAPDPLPEPPVSPNPAIHHLAETIGWTSALRRHGAAAMREGLPLFIGGDHSLSLGSVAGVAEYAAGLNRPLFVLWLDAHSDIHTPLSTRSGNLHGTPVAYLTGQPFAPFPPFPAPVPPERVCLFGIRSVDPAERAVLEAHDFVLNDMRTLDEMGVVAPLRDFLETVREANGLLHVSLDVDFLDPSVAPAIGTTVDGGATLREAHLVMELLHESGLVNSVDLVELNPFLDERARTAHLMVDLLASLMGRKVLDRPTRSWRGRG